MARNDKHKEDKLGTGLKRPESSRVEISMLMSSAGEVKPGKRKRQPSRKAKGDEEESDKKRRDLKSPSGDRGQGSASMVGKRQASQRLVKKVGLKIDVIVMGLS